jgi:aspartyl-tRNA(Asn)/glutamyl-tRNA(Gln) amidotransferase subunit B
MEEGSLRGDANISLRPQGGAELGVKVEIKNMNSFKHVQRALEFEAARQARALPRGERIVQETRLFNPDKGETRSMRSKEYAHDYRYFPEPDLVPLRVDRAWVGEIEASLPEMPRARRQRFQEQYALPASAADLLTSDRALADYYEEVVRLHPNPKAASNWIMSELLRELKGDPAAVGSSPIRPDHLAALLRLQDAGTISGKIAKELFERMARTGEDPEVIVREEGLVQVADSSALSAAVEEVVAKHPQAVADFREGKRQSLGFLVGQVMKVTQGKANPQLVNQLLLERLPRQA